MSRRPADDVLTHPAVLGFVSELLLGGARQTEPVRAQGHHVFRRQASAILRELQLLPAPQSTPVMTSRGHMPSVVVRGGVESFSGIKSFFLLTLCATVPHFVGEGHCPMLCYKLEYARASHSTSVNQPSFAGSRVRPHQQFG